MATELTDFLEAEGAPADVAPPLADPPADDPAPRGDTADAGGGLPPPVDPPAVAADEDPDHEPEDLRGTRDALLAERAKRRDYKGQADRLTGELTATKAELETLRAKLAAPPATPVAVTPAAVTPPAEAQTAVVPAAAPNPATDPEGYQRHIQRVLFNERLNTSEAMLRETKPAADVDEKMAVFKAAAEKNPQLRAELARAPHPYKWAYEQAQRIMALSEIGPDPTAYRAKIEQEVRDKILAEQAAALAAPDPAGRAVPNDVHLPRSLASAPSSGPRTAPVEAAPEFDDVFRRDRPRR